MRNGKVLVTGGCGFIGKHLCRRLVESGKEVVILDITAPQGDDVNGCKAIRGDVCDSDLVKKLLQDIDTIYHLAALSTFQGCRDTPRKALSINAHGTAIMLQEAVKHKVGNFVFFSSASVYSGNREPVKNEKMKLRPRSIYGITKLMGESLCADANRICGLPCAYLRPFNVYGEGGRGVINKFADAMRKDKHIIVYRDGSQTRDYIHVDDVVRAAIAIGESRLSGAYNAGTGGGCTLLELKKTMEQISGVALTVEWQPREPWDIQELIADTRKMAGDLLITPTPLNDGLADLLKKHEAGGATWE